MQVEQGVEEERVEPEGVGEAMSDEGMPAPPPQSSKAEVKEDAQPTNGQPPHLRLPSPSCLLRRFVRPVLTPTPSLPSVCAVSLFSSLPEDARQRLLALKIKLRAQQLLSLQQRIASHILRLKPFPAEPPPPPPPPPPPALPPPPSVVLLDPRQFLVRRPSSFLSSSIPSLAPFIPARPPIYTAAQLLARMPVQALPSTVSQPLPPTPVPASLTPSTSSSTAKNRRDAELAEAARRHALRVAELEEQRKAKELMRQRRALRRHFLSMVKAHREGFMAFHRGRLKALGGMARAASKNQEVVERRRKAMEEKSKKDRMRALKENDMSEYLKLLEGHKSDRLTALLAQTDEYLKQLGKMIRGGGTEEMKQVKQPKAYIGRGNRTWRKEREEREAWEQKEREAGRDPNISWAQRQARLREEKNEREQKEENGQHPMEQEREESREEAKQQPQQQSEHVERDAKEMSEEEVEEEVEEKAPDIDFTKQGDLLSLSKYGELVTEQPKLLSGGTLKGYQLKGLEWMVGLYNCLADDTQLLTEDGFLFVDDVKARLLTRHTLRIACYNSANTTLEYHPIHLTDVIDQRGLQHLVHFQSDPTAAVDLLVTANHDMLTRQSSPFTVPSASSASSAFTKTPASSLVPRSTDDARAFHFLTAAAGGVDQRRRRRDWQPFVLPLGLTSEEQRDAFLELYGHWLSSGGLDRSSSSITLNLTDDHAQRYLVELTSRLPSLDVELVHDEAVDGGRARLLLRSPQWWALFAEQCDLSGESEGEVSSPASITRLSSMSGSVDSSSSTSNLLDDGEDEAQADDPRRVWPWVLTHLGKTELRLLVKGLRSASVPHPTSEEEPMGGCVSTSSALFRDQLQHLLLHAGYSSSFTLQSREREVTGGEKGEVIQCDHHRWLLSYSQEPQAAQPLVLAHQHVTAVQPACARVWCVSVPQKDQLIVARRVQSSADGVVLAASRPTITGNSKMNGSAPAPASAPSPQPPPSSSTSHSLSLSFLCVHLCSASWLTRWVWARRCRRSLCSAT